MAGTTAAMTDFANKKVVVMGLGRFGGGIGVTRWLVQQGAHVTVTDLADEVALAGSVERIADLPVELCLGGHDDALLEDCALLVKSPAVDRRNSKFFNAALDRGVPWSSEMNLFLERCPAKIVGITGSAGKSTTTGMVAEILKAASASSRWQHGRVYVGGNIGASLLDNLNAMRAEDIVVLELSSFQLEDAQQSNFRPSIGLITNLRENHLDRHGDMANYAAAKAQLFRSMMPDDVLLLPHDFDDAVMPQLANCRAARGGFGIDAKDRISVIRPDGTRQDFSVALPIPGRHNLMNAAGASALAMQLNVEEDQIVDALQRFKGLPHRLALVAEVDGVRYFNDSKATSPAAAMTSIAAFDQKPIVIVGGSDKGGNFAEFGGFLADHAQTVICIGATAANIAECIVDATTGQAQAHALMAKDLADAVQLATKSAHAGAVVLLAPGCPSYDSFQNYEQRGDAFAAAVHALNNAPVS